MPTDAMPGQLAFTKVSWWGDTHIFDLGNESERKRERESEYRSAQVNASPKLLEIGKKRAKDLRELFRIDTVRQNNISVVFQKL